MPFFLTRAPAFTAAAFRFSLQKRDTIRNSLPENGFGALLHSLQKRAVFFLQPQCCVPRFFKARQRRKKSRGDSRIHRQLACHKRDEFAVRRLVIQRSLPQNDFGAPLRSLQKRAAFSLQPQRRVLRFFKARQRRK